MLLDSRTTLAITLTALIVSAFTSDDLLDEYVNHIDQVNRPLEPNQRPNRIHQRTKRDDLNQWTHTEILDRHGDVVLRWQPRHQEIAFRVEGKTRGYIGIGFSPNGAMEGSDIILAWVDDRSLKPYLLDCHGLPEKRRSAPVRDEIDNYTLMKGMQNDTHTVIEFRRAVDTCDPDDFILGSDTVHIIWALHDSDPRIGAEMVYHGEKKGSQSIYLLGPPPVQISSPSSQIRQWDVVLKNFEIQDYTTYWCKIFKAPTLQQKHHIVGYEPLIGSNHSEYVHHMLLHECEIDYEHVDFRKWETFVKQPGKSCYGSDLPPEWSKCLTPLVAWAVGSKGENFPEHVGLPVAQRSPSYYMLEVHFANPYMKIVSGTTGLRLHYTHKLRDNEGGIFVTGVMVSSLHLIPPWQPEYKTAGYCSMDCTKEVFPKDGVNIVSVLLHSHLAGRKLRLRHIRAGRELLPIVEDDNYDFNYQQSRILSHEVTLIPGDGLVTECTYNTLDRNKTTLGGYSTSEEMCLAFVLHYPRTHLAGCYSMPPVKYFFENLGVREFYNHTMLDVENMFLNGVTESAASPVISSTSIFPPYSQGDENSVEANQKAILALQNAKDFTEEESPIGINPFEHLIIKEPAEFRNKSFMSHLENMPFTEVLLTKRIEEYFYIGLHLSFCRKRDDSLAIPEKKERFPNFTTFLGNNKQIKCSYKLKQVSTGVRVNGTLQLVIFAIVLYNFIN